jgi:hypothetical protein
MMLLSMVRRLALSVATAISFSAAAPAMAGTIYELSAIANDPGAMGNFSIQFDDVSGDGLLQLGEITNFSGLTHFVTGFSYQT